MNIRPTTTAPPVPLQRAQAPASSPSAPLDRFQASRVLLGDQAVTLHPSWTRDSRATVVTAETPGTVVIGTRDGHVDALDPHTGEPLWSVPLEGLQGTPTVGADGSIYAVCGQNVVVALGPDGAERWRQELPGRVVGPPAVSRNGTMGLLVKHEGDQVYCLDAASGERRWNRMLQVPRSMVMQPPTITPDGTILAFDSVDYTLWALDPQNGRSRWKYPVGDLLVAPPSTEREGTVLVPRAFGDVVALDAGTGHPRWKQRLGPAPAPAAAAQGPVFVRADGNHVAALDPRDGNLLWQREVTDAKLTAPAVDPLGNVVLGGSDGVARALDPGSGEPRWTARLGGDLGRPVAGPAEEIYFADGSGRVIALNPRAGLAAAMAEPGPDEAGSIQVNAESVSIGSIDLPIRS